MQETYFSLDTWTLHILRLTTHFFSNAQQQAYLVGGSVRNLLLHEPCLDWDIAATGDTAQLTSQLAQQLGGFYAPMHEKASRIVLKHDQQEIIIDIAPLHGATIETDLHQRDFTINAIALSLSSLLHALDTNVAPTYIDPFSGISALEARQIRAVSSDIFIQDPLRMLRAVRFMTRYHLTIEPATERLIHQYATRLPTVAPERVHEELYMILQPENATERLRYLDRLGLFMVLFPEFQSARHMQQPALHHWDVLDHSLETVATLERLAKELQQPIEEARHSALDINQQGDIMELQRLLYEAEEQDLFHFSMLLSPQIKLGALLHDIGKTVTYACDEAGHITFYHHPQAGVPFAQQIMKRLHSSVSDRRLVQQIVAHHMRPGQLSQDQVTKRAIRRYFVDLGPSGIYVGLVALADHLSMRGPEPLTVHWQRHLATIRLMFTSYIRERKQLLPPRLIQADELMRHLHITPGPIVGQLLEAISEAQTEGQLQSKEEVIWFAEEKLQQLMPPI
ncbi:MAG TPA: HD domain-containing protein [Dictyobacter sp.]|jgi:tRNA nucleotidyltransferase/poly(A) polymerase|nr:HD domain-containing protein [Dictyobacter sp.]